MNYHLGIALSYGPHKLCERNRWEICLNVKPNFIVALSYVIGKPSNIMSDVNLIKNVKCMCAYCKIHIVTTLWYISKCIAAHFVLAAFHR